MLRTGNHIEVSRPMVSEIFEPYDRAFIEPIAVSHSNRLLPAIRNHETRINYFHDAFLSLLTKTRLWQINPDLLTNVNSRK